MSGTYDEVDATSEHEPQEYQPMTPEQEKAFEEWARRLVPACLSEPF